MPEMSLQLRQAVLQGLVGNEPPPPPPAKQEGTATQQAPQGLGLTAGQLQPDAQLAPTDSRALDRVAGAVEWRETGGRDDAVSPDKKHIGPMQIGPEVAADYPHLDRNKPAENRAIGRAELDKLHDKYGNWVDALAAYNWGQGNVDNWIAGGRKQQLPKETRNYINDVQEHAGLGGALVVVGKREVPWEDRQKVLGALASGTSGAEPGEQPGEQPEPDMAMGDIPEAYENADVNAAFLTGARRELMDFYRGPKQAALEAFDPEAAQQYTAAVRESEASSDPLVNDHPVAAAMGRVVALTGATLGTSGLLGAIPAVQTLGEAVPAVIKYGTTSGLLAGTSFRQGDEWLPRWAEAAVGAVWGITGVAAAKSLGWGARYLSKTNAWNDFKSLLQDSVGDFEKSASQVKSVFVDHFNRVTQTGVDKYTLRNSAGKEFPGFDPNELVGALRNAVQANREAGVSNVTQAVENRVVKELGLPELAAQQKAHDKAQEVFEQDHERWLKDNFGKLPPGPVKNNIVRDAVAMGRVPPEPVPPDPLEPLHVTPERFAAADQAISRALGRAKNDAQLSRQLQMMRGELERVGVKAAGENGIEAGEYLNQLRDARAYWSKNVGPIRDQFGSKQIGQIAQGSEQAPTTLDFANQALQAIKTNDVEKLRPLMKNLGPGAKDEVVKLVNWQMLQEVMKPKQTRGGLGTMARFVRDREKTLTEVLGRDRVTELKGMANLSQELMEKGPQAHPKLWRWGTQSFLLMIGGEHVVEGLLHGDVRKMVGGLSLIGTPFAVHAIFRMMGKLGAATYTLPLIRAAAKMKPGSAEIDKAIRQIEFRLGLTGAVLQRGAQDVAQDAGGP